MTTYEGPNGVKLHVYDNFVTRVELKDKVVPLSQARWLGLSKDQEIWLDLTYQRLYDLWLAS